MGRYSRRKDAIDRYSYSDDGPLADTVARDLLISRIRSRNASYSELPSLPEEQLALPVDFLRSKRLDVSTLQDIPSYGPSVISLWADAKAQGHSDREAGFYIWRWANFQPPAWDRDAQREKAGLPKIDRKLAKLLRQVTIWRLTGDVDRPWEADVPDHRWQVRLNDFPDDYMYSLLIDGEVAGDFHNWPQAWDRGQPRLIERNVALVVRATPKIDPATLLSRYRDGDREAVWRNLVALGADVRKKRYSSTARAVARETMRRAGHNVKLIVDRLQELDYEFLCDLEDVARPSTPEERYVLAAAERGGLWVPLSLRAWVEEVGWVMLAGSHDALCPVDNKDGEPGIYCDPLQFTLHELSGVCERWDGEGADDAEPISWAISFDAADKAGLALDWEASGSYGVQLPNAAADAVLEGESHGITFVEYLRLSFQWGGFPGWANYEDRPEKELAYLREGLLPL